MLPYSIEIKVWETFEIPQNMLSHIAVQFPFVTTRLIPRLFNISMT